MMRLFRLLGHVQVTKQILALLADSKRNVVALRQLTGLLFELFDEEVEGLYTLPEFTSKSIYLRRMLSELPQYDYLTWKPTPRLLRKALEDSDAQVRELALGIDHPCWDDNNLATTYLLPMASDADERIRRAALAVLGEKHPALFKQSVHDTIVARKIGDRTLAELRYLLRLVLQNEGPNELRPLLEIRGWFGSDAIEYAKMAAMVLIESGDEDAIAAIEAKSNQLLTSPALKKSYTASLQRFRDSQPLTDDADEGPAAEPPKAVDEPELDDAPKPAKKPDGPPIDEDFDFDWDER